MRECDRMDLVGMADHYGKPPGALSRDQGSVSGARMLDGHIERPTVEQIAVVDRLVRRYLCDDAPVMAEILEMLTGP